MSKSVIRGRRLELDWPTPVERDWIFAALQRHDVYLAFDCPRAPTRQELDDGALLIAGHEEPEAMRPVVARFGDGRPLAFFLVFAWEEDPQTCELDSSIPDEKDRGFRNVVEAYVLLSCFLYHNRVARRLRVQQPVRRDERPRWLEQWGGRYVGLIDRVDPVTGARVKKHVHEHTPEGLVRASAPVKRVLAAATVHNGEPLARHARFCAEALATFEG